jgi:hypothetical protein
VPSIEAASTRWQTDPVGTCPIRHRYALREHATMRSLKEHSGRRECQRGLGLFGLLFVLILLGGTVLVALKVFPTVNEYLTIQRAVERIAASGASSVQEVRSAFEATKAVEYSITSISGKDLQVTKEGDKVVIRYAYNVEVALIPPVFLLMKYEGRSK